MRVAITGATGLIGRPLCSSLIERGYDLIILTRTPDRARRLFPSATISGWDVGTGPAPARDLQGLDGIIHLAGSPVASKRWTPQQKALIRISRVDGTHHLIQALRHCSPPPGVLLNSSAVGFYGDRNSEVLDESSPPGTGFMADVCRRWEGEAEVARTLGVRVVLLRTGMVLARQGGALPRMIPPFKWFVGGPLGSGKQWISWIHIKDVVESMIFLLENQQAQGAFNLTAPSPATNAELSRALGKTLGRPSIFKVPAFVLRLLLGEMAKELLLVSQRVQPRGLLSLNYPFQFSRLEDALQDLL